MSIISVISGSGKSAPAAPTIGTATNVGTGRAYNNGAATVTFTAPTFTGRSAITSYTVTSSPGGFTATGGSSPLTVTGLQSATAYTFTVTATNAAGFTSAASAASNSITATTVPQAPTIGTATDGGTGTTVSVAFTGNATGGTAITNYTATSSPGGLTGTGAGSPITVSGLTAGTAYTFTVTATNANGTSTASAASNSVTPAVPSSWTQIATQTYGGGGAVYLQFTGIPTSYKHLYVTWNDRHTNETGAGPIVLVTGGGDQYSLLSFNVYWQNGKGGNFNATNYTSGYYYFFNVNSFGGVGSSNTTVRASHSMLMSHYTSSSFNRTGYIRGGHSMRNGAVNDNNQSLANTINSVGSTATTTEIYLGMYSGGPSPTNPFEAGSMFTLWGIA